jgi:hypothetical protein
MTTFRNNHIVVRDNGLNSPHSAAVSFYASVENADLQAVFDENVFDTDRYGLCAEWSGGSGAVFRRNRWIMQSNAGFVHLCNSSAYKWNNIRFYDDVYQGDPRNVMRYVPTREYPAGSVWKEHFSTLTVAVRDSAGLPLAAHITVTEPALGTVFDADSGANGQVAVDCKWLRTDATNIVTNTAYGPFTITANRNGDIAQRVVDMSAGPRQETFSFAPQVSYTLTLSGSGEGQVRVNGTPRTLPWSGAFPAGSTMTLEAVPDNGWSFSNWSGDASGAANPVSVVMGSSKTVMANFVRLNKIGRAHV